MFIQNSSLLHLFILFEDIARFIFTVGSTAFLILIFSIILLSSGFIFSSCLIGPLTTLKITRVTNRIRTINVIINGLFISFIFLLDLDSDLAPLFLFLELYLICHLLTFWIIKTLLKKTFI